MKCPTIQELPPPPLGKTGWPWTEESFQFPDTQPDDSAWPRISIVTPSYNQGSFIEETIRSVLLQGYPNLEYIIIDGGSTDGSVEIIRKYERWLGHWISEPDRGQSHAINKGFRQATGDIMAYLNSDDLYHPNAIGHVASMLLKSNCDILVGALKYVELSDGKLRSQRRESPNSGNSVHQAPIFASGRIEHFQLLQPSMFWHCGIWEKVGELNELNHYNMDREWCLQALAAGAVVCVTEQVLATFTIHAGSKTKEQNLQFVMESARMYWRLSHMAGFRKIPCLVEALRYEVQYFQDRCYVLNQLLREDGRLLEAVIVRLVAAILRRFRLKLQRLALLQRQKILAKSSTVKVRPESG